MTAPHLAPHACYVCGAPGPHAATNHTYWSNADADAYVAAESARLAPAESPEARYVRQHRPY